MPTVVDAELYFARLSKTVNFAWNKNRVGSKVTARAPSSIECNFDNGRILQRKWPSEV